MRLRQETDYPWDGKVTIRLDETPAEPLALMLRIPGWATRAALQINGERTAAELKPGTYVAVRRKWSPGDVVELRLPMDVALVQAHPLIEEARNQMAVTRGPIVYCLESPDLPKDVKVDDVAVRTDTQWAARRDERLLGGIVVLEAEALVSEPRDWAGKLYQRWDSAATRRVNVKLIPYYAWANRGVSQMTVWLPVR